MPYSTLHGEAAKTFEDIYNNALKEYKDKGKAAQTAWAALKKQGYRKGDTGEWHKSQLAEFSMAIVKASYDKQSGGVMRFRAVASDTEPDLYGESMSPGLFQDFTDRIEQGIPVPEQFKSAICEDTWCGGIPYPSISHFKAGPGGANVPGALEKVYVDGNRLKSEGMLSDNELGRAVFKALIEDLHVKKSDPTHQPVRISIGFLDLQHGHIGNGMNYKFERKNLTDQCPMCLQNIGGKVYQKGVLVHLAFTRVPVNPRTEAEVERSMSDAIVTKQDDAASIIGKDLADILVDKSQVDTLVIKSDGEVERASGVTREPQLEGMQSGEGKTLKLTDASIYNSCYDPNTGLFNQECIDQAMMGHMPAMRKAMSEMWPNKGDGAPEKPANDYPGKWLAMFSTTKKEPDGEHPASHYLYAGDSSKPGTWHLPVKDTSGKISPKHLGAAHAALTKGFRGNKYGGPGKGKALAKLHGLYKQAGMKWPEDSDSKKEKAMATNVEKGKIQGAPVPGNPKMIDQLNEDEIYPEPISPEETMDANDKGGGMGAPAGEAYDVAEHNNSTTRKAKPFGGKESDAEEEAEKGKKPMKEKALVLAARSLINQVMQLKSQGVYGNDALVALQPHMNQFGEAIKRSVTYSAGGDEATAQAIAALTQEIATLKAQIAQQGVNPQVTRSQVPTPRSLSFNPGTMTALQQQAGGELGGLTVEKKPFSQIAAIARKSVGAG